MKRDAIFKRVVEKYIDKVYNFYYKIVKNEDICSKLVLLCFDDVNIFLQDNMHIEECDFYKIAVRVLKNYKGAFTGNTIYYDFYVEYAVQNELQDELDIKLNNVDFCFFKLKFEEKLLLCLKYLLNLKDWEIAYIICEREKLIATEIEVATANLLKLMIGS